MPTAIIAFVRLGPSIATIASASRKPGKASRMSMKRMMSVSTTPP